MKPVIGMIVIYHFTPADSAELNGGVVQAPAVVTQVFNETLVNLTVFNNHSMTGACRREKIEHGRTYGRWSWPEHILAPEGERRGCVEQTAQQGDTPPTAAEVQVK